MERRGQGPINAEKDTRHDDALDRRQGDGQPVVFWAGLARELLHDKVVI